jgi:sucrose-6-phosphate hydrolase SacC (GH32 family)
MMNDLPWDEYPISINTSNRRKELNAPKLYQEYRNTRLPNIMKKPMDYIIQKCLQYPLFYGSSHNKDKRKEWLSHRKIMDLVLIRFLINKYKENATIITKCYNNHYLYDFIDFYTDIFNAIDPNFIRQFNQKKLLEIRSEQREHLKSLLDENMIEIFQKKLQDLELYETIMSELHPNSTTKMQQLEMLISKYRQILAILEK